MKWQAKILIVAVLLASCATIDGIVLDCVYRVNAFTTIGNRYSCVGRVLYDGNGDRNVTTVYGIHEAGKGHADVEGIVIQSQSLEFIPTNIESFFPNIIALNFNDNKITTISNRHLIPFPNLQYLWLNQNQLTSVDGDLFSGQNSMRIINFVSNNIRNVGHDLNLPSSGDIRFTSNACISATASSPTAVANLKLNLLRNCPPTILQIEDSLERRTNILTRIDGQVQTIQTGQEDLFERMAYLESFIENQLEARPIKQFLIDAFEKNRN